MCKKIKNTRWLCHATRKCNPKNKYIPSLDLRPGPFVALCDKTDAFTAKCYGEREVVDSGDVVFHKTLECPKHHGKRLRNLQEVWDAEWEAQILEARPGRDYRQRAEMRKESMSAQRDALLRALEAEAEKYNDEFYREALTWQDGAIAQIVNEIADSLI